MLNVNVNKLMSDLTNARKLQNWKIVAAGGKLNN